MPSRDKPRKRNLPISFTLPKLPGDINEIAPVIDKFKSIFEALQITYKIINKRKNELTLDITALTNTWSNQRRKRRLMKRMEEDEAKKLKLNIENNATSSCMNKTEETIVAGTIESSNGNSEKEAKDTQGPSIESVVNAIIKICNKDERISVEMEFLGGTAGKEGLHQIIQYIKNNFKYYVVFLNLAIKIVFYST